ncbi:hypothetical protein KAU33_00790, partial [Candidatus Dependentiae bacterium]|nr:hypothetical protein [Candidatus Dependentiae bacterium]
RYPNEVRGSGSVLCYLFSVRLTELTKYAYRLIIDQNAIHYGKSFDKMSLVMSKLKPDYAKNPI